MRDVEVYKNRVTRSKSLKCSTCKKPLPMGTVVYFILEEGIFKKCFCLSCGTLNDDVANYQEYEEDLEEDPGDDMYYASKDWD